MMEPVIVRLSQSELVEQRDRLVLKLAGARKVIYESCYFIADVPVHREKCSAMRNDPLSGPRGKCDCAFGRLRAWLADNPEANDG